MRSQICCMTGIVRRAFEEAADAGGLLTNEVVFERDSLIEITGMKHADSYLVTTKSAP